MKYIKYTLMLLSFVVAFASCTKDETKVVFDPANAVSGVVNTPQPIVLEDATKGEDLPAITWSASSYGFDAAVNYTVELALDGNNFQKVKVIGSVNVTSLTIKGIDLQSAMDYLGATLGEMSSVQMRVKSQISPDMDPLVSTPVTFNVTTYRPAEKEYNKVWIVGDYCGWNHSKSQFLYDIEGDGRYFEGWVMFNDKAQNGFKITYTGGWNGDDIGTNASEVVDNKIKVEPGGNISLFSGRIMYLKLDNQNQSNRILERVKTISRIGIIGSATPNGWSSPDVEMTFNTNTNVFEALDVELTAGEIKFRADNDWAISWGLYDASAGKNPDQLTTANGKNIPVEAGRFKLFFNLNKVDPTFELVKLN